MAALIRPATQGDIAAVCRLMEQVHSLHQKNRPDIYRSFHEESARASLLEMLTAPAVRLFVAEEDGGILGYCCLLFREMGGNTLLHPRKTAYIEDICVDRQAKRRGIGRMLFEYAQRAAGAEGADAVELMVWSFNADAAAFYQQMGMTPKYTMMELSLPGREGFDG